MNIIFPALKKAGILTAAATAVVLMSCSPIRQIRPLDIGESSIALTAGGPITDIGAVYIPLPLVGLGYNYGLIEKVDLEVGAHLLQAAFGIMQIDLGANWRPMMPKGFIPGLIATPRVQIMTDFSPSSLRIYPELIFTGWWKPREWISPYLGLENWFVFAQERPDGNEQIHHWLWSPYLGLMFYSGRWHYQLEGRIYSPDINHVLAGAPGNIGLGDNGVIGVSIGVGYEFGGKK